MYGPSQNGIKAYSLVEKLSCSEQMFFLIVIQNFTAPKLFLQLQALVHDYLILITFNEF
jgi:hypothetical protein